MAHSTETKWHKDPGVLFAVVGLLGLAVGSVAVSATRADFFVDPFSVAVFWIMLFAIITANIWFVSRNFD